MILKKFGPQGSVGPQGYIHVYFRNNEISSPMKPLGQSAKLHMEHPWEGVKKVYINGQGHMTKMAAMAINRKNILKSSSPEPEDQ